MALRLLALLAALLTLSAPAYAKPAPATPAVEVDPTKVDCSTLPADKQAACEELKAKAVQLAPAPAPPNVEIAKPPPPPVVTLVDPKPIPMPVDGLPRARQIFGARLAHTGPNYWGFRGDYQYQAWLHPSWALVIPVRLELVAGGHDIMQDLRLSAEVGVQHATHGKVGTLYQQLRVGFWGDVFPAQVTPSITYVFDGEVGHRILDIYGLVSWRPTLTTEDQVVSEGSSGIWLGKKSGWRLAGAWDTENGVGPRIDLQIKTVRVHGTFFLGGGSSTIALGGQFQF